MNIYPLKHYSIPQQIHGLLDDHAQRIRAAAIDMTDNLIVQAITQAAKEEGVTDLYLIDKKFAADAIKEKLERENPQPLTIEELRQINGEPVWLDDKDEPSNTGWVVWTSEHTKYWIEASLDPGYGSIWTAYRHKPKEVEK